MTSKDEFAGHTPGPWHAFYKAKYDEHHVSIPIEGGNMRLALFRDGIRTNSPEADSKLIAAAPRLLSERDELREALTDLIARFERCCRHAGSDEEIAKAATEQYRTLLNKREAKHG